MLAIEYLERIIANCQRAKDKLDQNDKRRAVGFIDEIEDDSEAVKWILINQIEEEEGKL